MEQLIELYNPKQLVGHSLGASEVLEYQKYNPLIKTRTYAAPIISMSGGTASDRYKHSWDPIALLDRKAITTPSRSWNPHSFTGYY